MQTWIYKTGINGETVLTVSEIAGKDVLGRIYREGIVYRPTQNEDGIPGDKEYAYEKVLGKFTFAYPFDGSENLDIPYDETN